MPYFRRACLDWKAWDETPVQLRLQNDQQLDFGLRDLSRYVDAHLPRLNKVFPARPGLVNAEILRVQPGGDRGGRNRQVSELHAGERPFNKLRHEKLRAEFDKLRSASDQLHLAHRRS